jgi:hypothetical protein
MEHGFYSPSRYSLGILCLIALVLLSSVAESGSAGQTAPKKSTSAVTTTYDSAVDRTSAIIKPYLVVRDRYDDPYDLLLLSAGLAFKGRKITEPPTAVDILVMSQTPESWQFANVSQRRFSAEIDGENIELGAFERVRFKTETFSPGPVPEFTRVYFSEQLTSSIQLSAFKKIAEGNKVTLGIGKFKFKLGKKEITIFRELLNLVQP